TRMTADLIVLGYLTGQIASALSFSGTPAAKFDISSLQEEWAGLGYYPEGYLSKPAGNKLDAPGEAARRVAELTQGKREYLYECIKLPKQQAVPLLSAALKDTADSAARLLLAQALAWFGEQQGNEIVLEDLNNLYAQEQEKGYPADFVDNYDLIRGREHNVLEGLYRSEERRVGKECRSRLTPSY